MTLRIGIVGGGIAGVAVGQQLVELAPGAVVELIDRRFLGAGSTARSAAAHRRYFSLNVNVEFSAFSQGEFARLQAEGHDLGLRTTGYLFVESTAEGFATASTWAGVLQSRGLQVDLLDASQVEERLGSGASIETECVAGAVLSSSDGFLDPLALLNAYFSRFRAMGGQYLPNVEATALESGLGRVTVVCADGSRRDYDIVVNAAGVWGRDLLERSGLPMPMRPYKRYLYHTSALAAPEVSGWPFTVLDGGAYFRPFEGSRLLIGWERRPDAPYPSLSAEAMDRAQDDIDPGYGVGPEGYGVEILIELSRVFGFAYEDVGLRTVTSGFYNCTPDAKPIISWDHRLSNLFHVTGFNGRGIMHAPAVGRTAAQLILDRATDLAPRYELEGHFGLKRLLLEGSREPREALVI